MLAIDCALRSRSVRRTEETIVGLTERVWLTSEKRKMGSKPQSERSEGRARFVPSIKYTSRPVDLYDVVRV
jgi:hypothetical protein